MQIIKILMQSLIVLGLTNPLFAAPPFQVLQSCMNGKPYNDKITIVELDDTSAVNKPLDGCEDQYEFVYSEHAYGTTTCNDKFYFIIRDKKIAPDLADNFSINPEIKPGVGFTPRALWYKIDYENKAHLCVLAPLSEQGIGSAYNQYYIIENAFNKDVSPELYFYFLNKDIVPITSKTL